MPEKGLVIQTSGNMITVKMLPLSTCGTCKACDARKRSAMTIRIENACHANVGDTVFVEMAQTILAGSVIFYGIPLAAFIAGILIGLWIAPGLVAEGLREPVAFAIGLFFLLACYLGIRLAAPLIKRIARFPIATAIAHDDLHEQ